MALKHHDPRFEERVKEKEELQKELAKHEVVTKSLMQRINGTKAVCRIPPEILRMIFDYALIETWRYETYEKAQYGRNGHPALMCKNLYQSHRQDFLYVCSYWRSTAIAYTSLWTTVPSVNAMFFYQAALNWTGTSSIAWESQHYRPNELSLLLATQRLGKIRITVTDEQANELLGILSQQPCPLQTLDIKRSYNMWDIRDFSNTVMANFLPKNQSTFKELAVDGFGLERLDPFHFRHLTLLNVNLQRGGQLFPVMLAVREAKQLQNLELHMSEDPKDLACFKPLTGLSLFKLRLPHLRHLVLNLPYVVVVGIFDWIKDLAVDVHMRLWLHNVPKSILELDWRLFDRWEAGSKNTSDTGFLRLYTWYSQIRNFFDFVLDDQPEQENQPRHARAGRYQILVDYRAVEEYGEDEEDEEHDEHEEDVTREDRVLPHTLDTLLLRFNLKQVTTFNLCLEGIWQYYNFDHLFAQLPAVEHLEISGRPSASISCPNNILPSLGWSPNLYDKSMEFRNCMPLLKSIRCVDLTMEEQSYFTQEDGTTQILANILLSRFENGRRLHRLQITTCINFKLADYQKLKDIRVGTEIDWDGEEV